MKDNWKDSLSKWKVLGTLSSDPPGQLDVLGHDGDPLGVDGTEVGVLEQSHEVGLAGSLRMRSSVDFWYLLISLRATVPGLYL